MAPLPQLLFDLVIPHKDAKFKFYYSTCLNSSHYQAKGFCLEFCTFPQLSLCFWPYQLFSHLSPEQNHRKYTMQSLLIYEGYISKSPSRCLGPMHKIKPYILYTYFIFILNLCINLCNHPFPTVTCDSHISENLFL